MFVDAIGRNDTALLAKITEPSFFKRIEQDLKSLDSLNLDLAYVSPPNIKMGCTLLSARMIEGAYINRLQNQELQ